MTPNDIFTESEEFSNAYTYLLPDYDDRKVLKMTAKGDPSLYMYDLEFADDGNLWEYNKKMDSRANFCIDARGYEELALAFNLKTNIRENSVRNAFRRGNSKWLQPTLFKHDACLLIMKKLAVHLLPVRQRMTRLLNML